MRPTTLLLPAKEHHQLSVGTTKARPATLLFPLEGRSHLITGAIKTPSPVAFVFPAKDGDTEFTAVAIHDEHHQLNTAATVATTLLQVLPTSVEPHHLLTAAAGPAIEITTPLPPRPSKKKPKRPKLQWRYHSGFSCPHRDPEEPNPCEAFDASTITYREDWRLPCRHCHKCFRNALFKLYMKVFALCVMAAVLTVLLILGEKGLWKLRW